jgi:hypothetical protein
VSEWRKKYSVARDQLYHVIVLWRQMQERISEKRRTPQLVQVLGIIDHVTLEAAEAFSNGQVLEVVVNRYEPLVLPGFEELLEEIEDEGFYTLSSPDDLGDDPSYTTNDEDVK